MCKLALIKKKKVHPNVYCGTLTTARTWKLPRCLSTGEWIKMMWYIHSMEYYSAIKRN